MFVKVNKQPLRNLFLNGCLFVKFVTDMFAAGGQIPGDRYGYGVSGPLP